MSARMQRPTHAKSDQLASNVTAILIAGPLLYTALGFFADRWLDTKPWLTLLGLLLGAALSMYLVWIRYGNPGDKAAESEPSVPTSPDQGEA
ncbi:AtpZ/AtpI family protein [Yimella sp. cx-573]|nr:AtpZ/AtpI family protein [Yimella sp. cx-573]